MIAMAWLKNIEKKRLLSTSPNMIAASLHQMAEKYDPQVAPTTLRLPEAVHAGFREKVFLYREANVLLALVDRVNPSSDGDWLFEPVFWEYERIIFGESSDHFGGLSDHPILRDARRQSVAAALRDLNFRMHPPSFKKWGFTVDWSRNWFASIGHDELNPARLEQFSLFWSNEYTAVQKTLEELEEIEFHECQGSD
ncbi:MAG TPA: hypothetical protein VN620_11815, partial [Candidatus Methylomirabilis sp.]|nr:hypothetical protein [Candidatus Methylomirabilis sp.]